MNETTELNFERLYYEDMKETAISCNYACKQLDSIEECYDIKKMTTQVLKSIIEYLVENQIKEIEEKNNKMKRISYKNHKLMKKDKKLKNLYTEALEKTKQ